MFQLACKFVKPENVLLSLESVHEDCGACYFTT